MGILDIDGYVNSLYERMIERCYGNLHWRIIKTLKMK